MNVLFISERQQRAVSNRRHVLIVEDDGTDDGGRIIGRIVRHDEAIEIARSMNWTITYDECSEIVP